MISEFISYLQGAGLTPSVEYALTSEPVEDYENDLPAILVYPGNESAGEKLASNLVIQNVRLEMICLLGCAIGDVETLKDELRQAVIGWVTGNYDAMYLAGGSTLGIRGGYIWRREVFASEIRIRQSL